MTSATEEGRSEIYSERKNESQFCCVQNAGESSVFRWRYS